MLPIYVPPDDSDGDVRHARPPYDRPWAVVSLVAAVIVVFIFFGFSFRTGLAMWPMLAVIMGVLLVLGLGTMLGMARRARWSQTISDAEKRKRGLQGEDRYALIDQLVDDLNDDEITYLRRRIEDREAGEQPLPEGMEALLRQNKDDRGSRSQ